MDLELENRESEKDRKSGCDSDVNLSIKKPSRVLHFSDGVLEEFSDTEDEVDQNKNKVEVSTIDESQMNWPTWMIHKAGQTKDTVVSGCEYVGEALASFLGITTSKFDMEYEEYRRKEEQKALEEKESQGWQPSSEGNNVPVVVHKY
ncbi:uncharacterized protein LOC132263747 [Phlebotomus argentipes]|uniref:uncharacterized protein LOC132263747 n=1 Tax=Phlebotomus argentipes TaxID=94469 RepID=UPI0028936404|nr:uncharacterized protein LOC132263747 [Phlebotomus argentipes]